MGSHEHDFNAHPDVVPPALVVLKGHVRRVVVGVVRRDGRLVGDVPRHVPPINHLVVRIRVCVGGYYRPPIAFKWGIKSVK